MSLLRISVSDNTRYKYQGLYTFVYVELTCGKQDVKVKARPPIKHLYPHLV